MAEYINWADEAASGSIVAPTTAKQHAGWLDGEQPPHEYFNWYQNRTDNRLSSLESPTEMLEAISECDTREGIVAAGQPYTVPQYRVGTNQLHVYLDGILCRNGDTYNEVGVTGSVSTTIEFTVDIPTYFQILVKTPIKIDENVIILTRTVSELEELVQRSVNFATNAGSEALYSPANTRPAVINNGDEFTVPQYTVGCNRIAVYIDGLLCIPGVSYEEVGLEGETSTSIRMLQEVGIGHSVIAKVV